MLDDYTLGIIEKKEFEEIANKTKRIPKDVKDEAYIRIYMILKNLLSFNTSCKCVSDIPVDNHRTMLETSYAELLIILNNSILYNEYVKLADAILDLDKETSLNVLVDLNIIELARENKDNIYEKLDRLKEVVSSYIVIPQEVRKPKISV